MLCLRRAAAPSAHAFCRSGRRRARWPPPLGRRPAAGRQLDTPTPPDGTVANKQGSRSVPSQLFPDVYKHRCLYSSTAYSGVRPDPPRRRRQCEGYGMDRPLAFPRVGRVAAATASRGSIPRRRRGDGVRSSSKQSKLIGTLLGPLVALGASAFVVRVLGLGGIRYSQYRF